MDEQAAPGDSCLYLWDGFVMYGARDNINSFHTHYAASILISFHIPFTVETKEHGARQHQAVLIPPNLHHRVSAPDTWLLVLQLDPDSIEYRPLLGIPDDQPYPLDYSVFADLKYEIGRVAAGEIDCAGALDFFREITARVMGEQTRAETKPVVPDGRITRVLKHLKSLEELPEQIPIAELAQLVELSPDRFRHLFKEQLGLPVRRYLLWLRLRRAGLLLRDGITLTQAAHAAGFFDSAHFSRTFKEMFGDTPSFLLSSRKRKLKVKFCGEKDD